ncbi:uroporphyrinogen-III C-methyltransferase [Niallia sp. NCCP-28]|uniref:uroporphyrinogen-III C-methyltransferase n=1 Tax=Niallia sp. NCCP-28 TaxID=2934712 RepID=UPI0020858EFE|nr:uroporphyrinogen-III C-methyltransferase [Niallia sp. NCCP-28]GKU82298.1 uroporphyrinogen-III C-methyltransferase [Niallia sp. NCCP-28]
MQKGKVYLVGAGPGDGELITVKGLEAIKRADVILYDRLINPTLLEHAHAECEFIYCGKLPHRHFLKQEVINSLLVEKALEGKIVVRLKGGDPSIFGRVGEEALAVSEHDIEFEMVPGITSGIAAPLYAGIPVTHRDYAGSFAIVTAHDKTPNGKPDIDWQGLVNSVQTMVFYMGVKNLQYICDNLISHGKSQDTPVILIQWGTYGRQKSVEGTLATIGELAEDAKITNPAITLVGEVVAIREKISWFEKKPLFGKQIMLIRTGTEESKLAKELKAQGADVIEFPKWKKEKAAVDDNIISTMDVYEKILFTSSEAVYDFFAILVENKIDIRSLKGVLYGLSSKTIRALESKGFAAFLCTEMKQEGKLLIVGDDQIKEEEPLYTIQYGKYELFITSKKTVDTKFEDIMKQQLEEAQIDTLLLPSSASVQVFLKEATKFGLEGLANNVEIVAMGMKTKEMADRYGISTHRMPEKPTVESLIHCLALEKELITI